MERWALDTKEVLKSAYSDFFNMIQCIARQKSNCSLLLEYSVSGTGVYKLWTGLLD